VRSAKPNTIDYDRFETLLEPPNPLETPLRSATSDWQKALGATPSAAVSKVASELVKAPGSKLLFVCDDSEAVASALEGAVFKGW
jgi:hypothetical protein